MPEFTDMLETMTDPAMRHAALVHLPVALALMGLVLAVILAVVRGRSARLAALTAVVFVLLALASWAAIASGTDAKAGLGSQATQAQQLVAEHEWMARRLWILALAAAGVAGFGLIPRATARAIASALALVAGVAVVAWVALTAHQGGTLVYRHAAGVARAQPPADVVRVETPDARVAFYHEHVAPLLADRCLGCHGSNEPAAGIDLGSIASLLGGGSGRPIVVPGRPDDSPAHTSRDVGGRAQDATTAQGRQRASGGRVDRAAAPLDLRRCGVGAGAFARRWRLPRVRAR